MTGTQWHAKIRRILAQVERQPGRAIRLLEALADRLESDASKGAGDWHVEQTREALSIVHSHLGRHRESADVMLRVASRCEQQATYYQRAFVSASATAALELMAAGNRRGAQRALRQAAQAAAGLRPPDKLFQEAQRIVRQAG